MSRTLTYVNNERGGGAKRAGKQGVFFARVLTRVLAMKAEALYEDDELDVRAHDDDERHEEDEHEYGQIEAHNARRALGPLDRARGATRLERVARPAEQRHGGPHERHAATRHNEAEARAHAHALDPLGPIGDDEPLDRDHRHQVDTRAADEEDYERADVAAELLEWPSCVIHDMSN